jgi:hypothetical protein
MNMEKSCQQKNSDSSKKFVRTPLIAIRRGPVLYTPKNAISAAPGAARAGRKALRLRQLRARSRLRLPCIGCYVPSDTSPLFVHPVRSAKPVCSKTGTAEPDGSASATRCAGPAIGVSRLPSGARIRGEEFADCGFLPAKGNTA